MPSSASPIDSLFLPWDVIHASERVLGLGEATPKARPPRRADRKKGDRVCLSTQGTATLTLVSDANGTISKQQWSLPGVEHGGYLLLKAENSSMLWVLSRDEKHKGRILGVDFTHRVTNQKIRLRNMLLKKEFPVAIDPNTTTDVQWDCLAYSETPPRRTTKYSSGGPSTVGRSPAMLPPDRAGQQSSGWSQASAPPEDTPMSLVAASEPIDDSGDSRGTFLFEDLPPIPNVCYPPDSDF